MTAYVHYLNAKVELGVEPTNEEIQLLREGMADVNGDIREGWEAVYPVLRNVIDQLDGQLCVTR